MKKNITQFLPLLTVIALTIGLSSCEKDEEPPVIPKLSFAAPTMTVNEADGTIEVEVTLDNPAPEDIIIEYSLGGNARNRATVPSDEPSDYEILSEEGKIEIAKGETTGTIEILLTSDYIIENPEIIEISIEDVDNEDIEITRDDEIEITIEQEDGLVIFLFWPQPTPDSTADMDIFVRRGATINSWERFVTWSFDLANEAPEVVFIPKAIDNVAYGLSYVYYEGTMNQLEFEVIFADFIDGDLEDESSFEVYDGVYNLANRNAWEEHEQGANSTQVVQTFRMSGGAVTELSGIRRPDSGSRMASPGHIDFTLKKKTAPMVSSESIRSLLKKWNRD